ncbi:hypothetical protein MTR_7g017520 [Medicago truncatula]|uniref:Uncharacterized protein n=1 Tax=Medicago truncatula TaxID=3880 RepID=G7KS09_MEDTR|nr:hypothetical protein MTR_7g017520 [Medicago truncatula]
MEGEDICWVDRRPLEELVGELVKNNFISVRLTYVMEGIAKYNPSILKTTHIEAFDAVVNELDAQNVMFCLLIIHFDPQEWIHGLTLFLKNEKQVLAKALELEQEN